MISYSNGLKAARAVTGKLQNNEDLNEFNVYVDTFNNVRETGYCLRVTKHGSEKEMRLWIYENRNSDEIAVSWGEGKDCDINNMFNDATKALRTKYYAWRDYGSAADFIHDAILKEPWED